MSNKLKEKWDGFIQTLKDDKKKRLAFFILSAVIICCLLILPFLSPGENPDQLDKNKVAEFSDPKIDVDKQNAYDNEYLKSQSDQYVFEVDSSKSESAFEEDELPSQASHRSSGYGTGYLPVPQHSQFTQRTPSPKPKEAPEPEHPKEPERRRRVPSDETGNFGQGSKRSYQAVIANDDKTVKSGSYVKIRIGEEINVDGVKVPRNTVLTGVAQYSEERMNITISSIRLGSRNYQVKWVIYDEDGQLGVAVPQSVLNDIAKDGATDAIDEGTDVEADVPIIGNVNVNLKKRAQEVSFIIRNGHRIYIKPKKRS